MALSTTVGCGSSDGAPDPNVMRVEKTCLQTRCQARHQQDDSNCSRCTSACLGASFDCDVSRSCESSCSTSSCDAAYDACEQIGFKATTPANASAEIDAACKRALKHVDECHWKALIGEYACGVFARTELPARASSYDCLAKLPCDSTDTSSCDLAPTNFGQRVCGSLAAKCGEVCDDAARTTLDMEGAWLRPDVMAAASDCAKAPNCEDVKSCFASWRSAVVMTP